MRLLSNLIKSNYIDFSYNKKRVIDSDNRPDICKFKVPAEPQRRSAKDLENVFVKGIQAESVEITEEHSEDADEILAKAKEEAGRIVEEAIKKADLEKEDICKKAKEEGYAKGKLKGQNEIEKLKEELKIKADSLEKDYNEKLKETEPAFVQLMIDYLYKLTGVITKEHEEVIHYLIHQGITGSESSKNYTVKVSKEDYKVVESRKEELISIIKDECRLEILEDNSLDKNECFIETDNRIIDCSLDTRLKNLITDLKILACI